jgi:O-antigen/teichoic acid export membrane protein
LVAEQVAGLAARFLLVWGPWRAWQPGIAWKRVHIHWLWKLGRPNWTASNLTYLLDHFDDFWVGTSLGNAALGLYAKAYEFARYPRRVFANPLTSVLGPVFAAAQNDRLQLSQLFYRSAYFIWRTNLLIAGIASLAMPEFIRYVIGEQWMPMLLTFRLMMIYMVLDSLLLLVNTLILHLGQPVHLQRTAMVQAAVFVPGVIIGSWLWQQDGVALAADVMLLVGAICLVRPLRGVVDVSLRRLLVWPTVIGTCGLLAAHIVGQALAVAPPLGTLLVRLVVFVVISLVGMVFAERCDVLSAATRLLNTLGRRRPLER